MHLALRRVERGDEFLQVGAGDEHARLGRTNHEPREVLALVQLVEMRVERIRARGATARSRSIRGSSSVSTAMSGSGNDSVSVVLAAMGARIPQQLAAGTPKHAHFAAGLAPREPLIC